MARFSYFLHPVFPQLRCPLLAIAMGLACVVMGQSKFTVNGRMKVESKKNLKARGVPSHNLADAVVMAYSPSEPGASGWFM